MKSCWERLKPNWMDEEPPPSPELLEKFVSTMEKMGKLTEATRKFNIAIARVGEALAQQGLEIADRPAAIRVQYRATRNFAVGATGEVVKEGQEVLFDGARMTLGVFSGAKQIIFPQLRGAIRLGWVVPVSVESTP